MFGRAKKPESTLLVNVVDHSDPSRIGVLEPINNKRWFSEGNRLSIFEIYPVRGGFEEAKVYINGHEGAGTVRIRNGNFHKGQLLLIESAEVSVG